MNKIKILTIFTLIFGLPSQIFAASLLISPSSGNKAVGCTYTSEIIINTNGSDVNAAEFEISYPTDLVEIIDQNSSLDGIQILQGDAFQSLVVNDVDTVNGKIKIVGASYNEKLSSQKTFAKIVFKVKTYSVSTINFNILFNGSGSTLDSNIADVNSGLDILSSVSNASYSINNDAGCASTEFKGPSTILVTENNGKLVVSVTPIYDEEIFLKAYVKINSMLKQLKDLTYTASTNSGTITFTIENPTDEIIQHAEFILSRAEGIIEIGVYDAVITPTPMYSITPTPEETSGIGEVIFEIPNNTSKIVRDAFATPERTSQTLNTVVTSSLVASATVTAFTYPQWIQYGFLWFKRRGKRNPWGIVYDSKNSDPVALANIKIFDVKGNEIAKTLSDMQGKFHLILDKGQYTLNILAPNFEIYTQQISIKSNEEVLNFDIGLNKTTEYNALTNVRMFIRRSFTKISNILFIVGFIATIISILVNINIINIIFFTLYSIQLGMIIKNMLTKNWGKVYNSFTKMPIKGAFVRLYDVEEGRQIDVQMSDKSGRYSFITKKNQKYLLKASLNGYHFPSALNANEVEQTPNGGLFVSAMSKGYIDKEIALDPEGQY